MSAVYSLLNQLIADKNDLIENWFAKKFQESPALFYNSVDIRHSGNKLAPIDTNIFPAGFNNLSPKNQNAATVEAKNFLDKDYPEAKKILLIPESHTRNLSYLDNVAIIAQMLTQAGREVEIGSLTENETINVTSANGTELTIQPLQKNDSIISLTNGFTPDLIIINNDLTSGSPEILQNTSQPIIPPVGLGWYKRDKHTHFEAYNQVAREFCREFTLDPFLISTEFEFCKNINFKAKTGVECVAIAVDKVLNRLTKKYAEIGIKEKPYVFIKANRGTYGMGIMTVTSAEEVLSLNKKERNKMNIIKNSTANEEVLVQEGITTIDTLDGAPVEPFVYMINGKTVGVILRSNKNRNNQISLNASGAEFTSADSHPEFHQHFACHSLIARLAALAASREHY
jgi:glutamate--cysteine ligase